MIKIRTELEFDLSSPWLYFPQIHLFPINSVENQLSNMEEVNLRFDHLGKQIYNSLDNISLVKCKEVNRSWKTFLENQKFLYTRIIRQHVEKFHEVGNAWEVTFAKSNTRTVMDLKASVGQFYKKDAGLTYYKGLTPLHVAAGNGHLMLFNLIQVEEKWPTDEKLMTPLHYAAQNGHLETCQFIVGNAVDKNPGDNSGWTPLHKAAGNGHLEVCRIIMHNILDKNPQDIFGLTPKDYALQNNHFTLYYRIFLSS